MRTASSSSCMPAVRQAGFSIVELMVAMVLGLVLSGVMVNVYLYSKNSVRRQEQLNSLQQSVRTAFEYLANDVRMIGHQGCFTGKAAVTNNMGAGSLKSNFGVGVEGWEYTLVSSAFSIGTSLAPADVTTAANWTNNTAVGSTTAAIDPSLISAGTGSTAGLTPGSDVLVVRSVAGNPMRLTVATGTPNATAMTIERQVSGTCSNGVTSKVSGFCGSSYGLIASCSNGRVFQVNTVTGSANATLTINGNLGSDPAYPVGSTEVFPLNTIAYYVKQSSTGTGTSLYRRIFDGDLTSGVAANDGLEQELIENVESMQITYGVDTTAAVDGAVDEYRIANAVTDWSRVLSVRMSLLLRASDPVEGDTAVAASGLVNGATITYPVTGRKFDRRVFTTTVAIRNRISYGL